jgi:hypothetical protein
MKIPIGEAHGKTVAFDLDTLITTRLLIQANSGAGKSWLLRVLIEQLYGHVQVIIIDPEGEFATLREKFDFVLVGQGGETPADTRSAAMLAERLLELKASAVCDLYEMRPGDRHKWVRLFLESMVNAPKKLWHPCIVVVDEAQMFCPEQGESESAEAMISLTTRGRKRGFCAVWATQRLAKLNKDASSMLQNRLIGGTFEDVDIKRALDLLSIPSDEKREISHQLRTLDPGMFYALGRAIAKERTLFKVAKVQTSHPQPGSSKHAAEPPPAPDKIRNLLPKLADLPQAAEEKARSIADLTREVRELKQQLKVAQKAPAPITPEDPEKQQRTIDRIVARMLNERDAQWRAVVKAYRAKVGEILRVVPGFDEPIKFGAQGGDAEVVTPPPAKVERVVQHLPPRQARSDVAKVASNGHLGKGEHKTLVATAQCPDGVERDTLTVLTGYKRSSRDTYIQRLREAGLVSIDGGRVVATQEGIETLGSDYEPLPTGDDLRAYWMQRLPQGERQTLEVLVEKWPESVPREVIDEATGYKRSSRDTYLQRLSSRRLVEVMGRGEVKASDNLFDG